MKHTDKVKNYNGSHQKLAEEIGDLYYDALADFLQLLSEKIQTDAQADSDRGRQKLAKQLFACSKNLEESARLIDTAWEICEPYTPKDSSS